MNINELKNKTILLFGRPRAFSLEEFDSQMKFNDVRAVKEFSDEVVLSVDGKMMTPYEQIASEELYERKIPSITIDVLEKELAKFLDKDTLLMSLKLSHDKERLKSFIQNATIGDELFFSLMKMYSWGGEDFFENDDNRDVSAAFIARFYENIERNHNVQYATTGFIHLVSQTKNSELLKAIALLEPLKFHPKIKIAIAMSPYCDASMQKRFYKSEDAKILEALSLNQNLAFGLVEEFAKNEYLAFNVSKSAQLTDELFTLLKKSSVALASNESLTERMQEELFSYGDDFVNLALAKNASVSPRTISKLLELQSDEVTLAVYQNSATPHETLNEAYKNPLYHEALAKNENSPVEILYQLQLDGRYERFVKTNAGFGRHIQGENIGWLV